MADETLKAELMSSDNHHTVNQVHQIIGNLLAAHSQDLTATQHQELQQLQTQLSQNSSYYQQNPGALQRIFNTLLGIAAPFILGYGITHILNRQAAENGQVGGNTFFPGGAPSFAGAGIGALIGGALPGIVEGLINNAHNAHNAGPHVSGTAGGHVGSSGSTTTGNWGSTARVQGFQPDSPSGSDDGETV